MSNDTAICIERDELAYVAQVEAQLAAAETTLEQTQALLSRREADVERLTQEVRRERGLNETALNELAAERRDYARLSQLYDGACLRTEDARAELATLRNLAEQASRAATMEERQMAASVLVARLVRPPSEPTCRDPSCGNAVREESVHCQACRDRLIAAAPDLLAALRDSRSRIADSGHEESCSLGLSSAENPLDCDCSLGVLLERVDAAISRAEGQS